MLMILDGSYVVVHVYFIGDFHLIFLFQIRFDVFFSCIRIRKIVAINMSIYDKFPVKGV